MTKQSENPFKFDAKNLFSDFKVPGVDVEALIASQQKNIEALIQANKLAADGVKAVFTRQAEIIRQTIEETNAAVKSLAEPGTPQDKVVRQTEIAKEAFERSLVNARELSELFGKSSEDAFQLLNTRFTQVLEEIKDSVVKAVPAASKPAASKPSSK